MSDEPLTKNEVEEVLDSYDLLDGPGTWNVPRRITKEWIAKSARLETHEANARSALGDDIDDLGDPITIALTLLATTTAAYKELAGKLPTFEDGTPIMDGDACFFPCANSVLEWFAYMSPQMSKVPPYPWKKCHRTKAAAEQAKAKQ